MFNIEYIVNIADWIPPKTTGAIEPLDRYLARWWKYLQQKIYDRVSINQIDIDVYCWNNILKKQFWCTSVSDSVFIYDQIPMVCKTHVLLEFLKNAAKPNAYNFLRKIQPSTWYFLHSSEALGVWNQIYVKVNIAKQILVKHTWKDK